MRRKRTGHAIEVCDRVITYGYGEEYLWPKMIIDIRARDEPSRRRREGRRGDDRGGKARGGETEEGRCVGVWRKILPGPFFRKRRSWFDRGGIGGDRRG